MQPDITTPSAAPAQPMSPLTLAGAAMPAPAITVQPAPTMADAATAVTAARSADAVASAMTNQPKAKLSDIPFISHFLEACFRIGFALVFIINSITALLQPASFEKLLKANFIAHALGHTQIMLYIIAVNDMAIGLLILFGFKKKYVYAWSGVWLFIVTFVKFTSL